MVSDTEGRRGHGSDESDSLLLDRARKVRAYSERWVPRPRDWPVLHSLLIKCPKHAGDKWLVVCKASLPDGEMVAFHKGSTLMAAIAGALQRVFTGHADWKADTPYRPPRG